MRRQPSKRVSWVSRGLVVALVIPCAAIRAQQPANQPTGNTQTTEQSPDYIDSIRQLGSESFEARRAAEQRLLKAGQRAKAALLLARDNGDPEVRSRSAQILAAIDANVLNDRLNALLADEVTDKHDAHLPGWKRFRETIGRDRKARELFVDMHRAEPRLMAVVDDPKKVVEELDARARVIEQAREEFRKRMIPGRGAALFFAAATPRAEPSRHAAYELRQICPDAIEPARGDLIKKIIGRWVREDQPGDSDYWKLCVAMDAMDLDLPEGLYAALRILNSNPRDYRAEPAILVVGRLGGREHMKSIEKMLENDHTFRWGGAGNRTTYTTEVRDVALAALIELTGQNHADYGLERVEKNSETLLDGDSIFFWTAGNPRAPALAKWRKWKAEQPPTTKRGDRATSYPPTATNP